MPTPRKIHHQPWSQLVWGGRRANIGCRSGVFAGCTRKADAPRLSMISSSRLVFLDSEHQLAQCPRSSLHHRATRRMRRRNPPRRIDSRQMLVSWNGSRSSLVVIEPLFETRWWSGAQPRRFGSSHGPFTHEATFDHLCLSWIYRLQLERLCNAGRRAKRARAD